MNEEEIKATMNRLINDRYYESYEVVARILDAYLAYDRVSKETYGELLELARQKYPGAVSMGAAYEEGSR